jgi:hypothetical protein
MSKLLVEVLVLSDADKKTTAEIQVETCEFGSRLQMGFRKGAKLWGAALLSVFVPVAHFILVPLFSVLGFVTLYFHLGKGLLLRQDLLECPNCREKFKINEQSFNWPLRPECPLCKAVLLIRPVG